MRALIGAAVRHPWSTAVVSARIRWQGVRLYLRGLRPSRGPRINPRRGSSDQYQHSTPRRGPSTRTGGPTSPWRRARPRAAVARALFNTAVARLPLRVRLPDGRLFTAPGAPADPVMVLHRPREFFRRFGASGLIGFGESYMAGEWDSNDLTGLLTVFAAHAAELVPPWLQRLRPLAVRRQPADDLQTVAGARRNIGRHYDLSNDLFALFLDETMTYSSALFPKPTARPSPGPARRGPAPQDRPAARPGRGRARLPGARGRHRLGRAGHPGRPPGRHRAHDHHLRGSSRRSPPAGSPRPGCPARSAWNCATTATSTAEFDAICSVEMLEAVGERYWDAYFAALDAHLAPGGRIGLQTITMPHDRMLATRHTYTWIQKYIFPGGLLPSVTAIENSLTEHPAADHRRARTSRPLRRDAADLAGTVRRARRRGRRLGFDEVFTRMWNFYLCYSEAGFRAGYIDVSQLTLARAMTTPKAPAEVIAVLLARAERGLPPACRLRLTVCPCGPLRSRSWSVLAVALQDRAVRVYCSSWIPARSSRTGTARPRAGAHRRQAWRTPRGHRPWPGSPWSLAARSGYGQPGRPRRSRPPSSGARGWPATSGTRNVEANQEDPRYRDPLSRAEGGQDPASAADHLPAPGR